MKKVIVAENDSGQRIDKFLTKTYKDFPISLIYKCIRKKDIKINNKHCKNNDIVYNGDIIKIYVKDDTLLTQHENYEFLKAPIKLDTLYEDNNIIVVNKPVGVLVHPDKSYHFDCLVSRLLHYLYNKGEFNPKNENSFTPAFANRIDRNTGGIVIAAKNSEALRILNNKIKNREIDKYYLAEVTGTMPHNESTEIAYLTKNEKKNKVFVSGKETADSKIIKTHYRVIKSFNTYSLLEIHLLTGRTHQIRAHMAFLSHPLLGDTKYSQSNSKVSSKYKYQALYSYKVIFSFVEDAGILNYLRNKEFKVNKNKIWFLNK